ncbi:hypothetical protein MCOR25_003592 [Pyricularia grisea]|uniref:Trichothecene 3-O-acetyltransferase-like N-terminal domain-containing protein n=1 Tax=Pyricularia grisea TaxID=148305 RepID=A0A6P8AR47_PYRGI|nr:uncharacterized protein PgNI_12002 [Pyricularia grisea]KAI6372908.1 hypothetical protein MCOR25_003592 [Pyricularia grisea]TLD04516.1 hypothetical protein PgNI_12002 [Pyricularia grisea]
MDRLDKDANIKLDILGQQPFFQHLYTQITLGFSLSTETNIQPIIDQLQTGIKRAADTFPWIAGQVVNHGASAGNTGTFNISHLAGAPFFTTNDLRDDSSSPSFEAMKSAGFPMEMLDQSVVSERKTFATDDGPREVLSVHAVFVKGGLLLTFAASHATMDASGQGQVIAMIAKACRGDIFSSEEIRIGNMARENLVPLLGDDYTPGPEVSSSQMSKEKSETATAEDATTTIPPPSGRWAYFNFSPSSLADLKDSATSTLPEDSTVPFLSTDDAITAFIWQSITRARLPRLENPSEKVKLTRAVDVRKYFNVPATYPGLLQVLNFHSREPQELVQPSSLGAVAGEMRSALFTTAKTGQEWDLVGRTRALATILSRSADKSGISLTASVDPSKDVMLSSWMLLKSLFEDADFGPSIGKPVMIRRPSFDFVEGLIYLLPEMPEGGIALAISLRDEDMERLRKDQDFMKKATYLG